MSLNRGKHPVPGKDMPRRRVEEYVSPDVTKNEGDVTAKFYYAKRKMVWEVLHGALKRKLEISWSDISAIRISLPEGLPGILEIELNQLPMFFHEINPQPRKHTLWQKSDDFTEGQAPNWRIHSLMFSPGVLDKHCEKLLQSDVRLCALAKMLFPSHASPFFNPDMFVPFSLDFNSYPYPPLPTMDVGTPSWAGYYPNGGMIDFGVAAAPSNNGLGLGFGAQPQYNVNAYECSEDDAPSTSALP